MKKIDKRFEETYVSPEIEILNFSFQSIILDSNEQIECNPDTDIPLPGGN